MFYGVLYTIEFLKKGFNNNVEYTSQIQAPSITVNGVQEAFTYQSITRKNKAGETPLESKNDIVFAGQYSLLIDLNNYVIQTIKYLFTK